MLNGIPFNQLLGRKRYSMSKGRALMTDWVEAALRDLGGRGKILQIAKHVWAIMSRTFAIRVSYFTNGNTSCDGVATYFVKKESFVPLTIPSAEFGRLPENAD